MEKRQTLGEQEHHAHLYERYAPAILAFLYKQIGSWEDSEDLLVEVFLAVLESRHFSEVAESDQERWLWKVTRHKLIDHFRRFARRPSLPLDIEVLEAVIGDGALTPEDNLLRREAYADLNATLLTLPQTQQEVLKLRFGYELECGQIAVALEKTEGAVRMLLFRAIKQLRKIYKKS